MSKILITGASGLIGRTLSDFLSLNNYEIIHVSRNKKTNKYQSFEWNLKDGYLESGALNNVGYIIHLAGAGIADKRWSNDRKNEIIKSRIKSTELLFNEVSKLEIKPKAFISASAIGFYGAKTTENIYAENDPAGNDFLSGVCKLWEESSKKFNDLNIRNIQMRLSVVLSAEGGALKKMILPTKLGIGSAIGSGKQYIPWIHIFDLMKIILKFIENDKLEGAYNLTSPTHTNYNNFAKSLAKILKKPFFMPNVPSFVLQLIFGEMSKMILEGSRISCEKIINDGYTFEYSELEDALHNLLIQKQTS